MLGALRCMGLLHVSDSVYRSYCYMVRAFSGYIYSVEFSYLYCRFDVNDYLSHTCLSFSQLACSITKLRDEFVPSTSGADTKAPPRLFRAFHLSLLWFVSLGTSIPLKPISQESAESSNEPELVHLVTQEQKITL